MSLLLLSDSCCTYTCEHGPASFLPNPLDYFARIHILAWEGEKDHSPKYPALFLGKSLG